MSTAEHFHERQSASHIAHGARVSQEYFITLSHTLAHAPAHRFYWWRVRLVCRLLVGVTGYLITLTQQFSTE